MYWRKRNSGIEWRRRLKTSESKETEWK